ncbi:MAG: hypothetical protein KF703_05720 [Actinobacteria bacterium]|nr:hypothetical protein [Actinomycetota bacterium]
MDGLEDAGWWRARQDDFLADATRRLVPSSPINVIDHLERARRDPSFAVDWDAVDDVALARWTVRIDGWLDCADFDVLRLLTIHRGYRSALPERVAALLEDRFVGFRYWYTDPVALPDGVVDERWYWSENHRLIFHTCELLAGEAFPTARFAVTGMTGAEHRDRAAARLHAWFDEKATDGFSEWHSDVYYAKDLAPLVTLAEFADDAALAERAAAFLDLVLYDLALHHHRGNVGCTHGRSYMKDKSRASDQPVFGAMKLCFDATDEPWPADDGDHRDLLPLNESASLLARAQRYRPPAILRRVATSDREVTDHEHMGMPIDPSGPVVPDPVRTDGRSYTDPELVPFWWDRSALTPWQLLPLTVATLDRHRLWDANLFALFKVVRDAVGGDLGIMQQLAADLHPMVNAGLLEEVFTATWRNGHGLLSSALAYRPGAAGFQHHAWQATLDERAVVFTTHPGNPPSANAGDYLDHDRYWTGSATLPCVVQHGRVAIVRYEPAFACPTDDLLAPFAYEPCTHAFFPSEHFDEVRSSGHWTVGRRRGAFVALWSWREPAWRIHDPAEVFTNGLVEPFDLVAEGGADDVWICELGDVDRWGSFDAFCSAVEAASVEVDDPAWAGDGPHPGFSVRYASPAEGVVASSPSVPLSLDGVEVSIRDRSRFRNPYTAVGEGATTVPIAHDVGRWVLDLAAGRRGPT